MTAVRRPRIPDAVFRQPFEFCISISLLVMGLRSLFGQGSLSGLLASPAVSVLSAVWVAAVLLGSSAIVISFLLEPLAERRGFKHISRNRILEQAGLILLATSALAFGIAVLAATGARGLYTLAVMSGVVAACILRLIALKRDEMDTLIKLRVLRERVQYGRD